MATNVLYVSVPSAFSLTEALAKIAQEISPDSQVTISVSSSVGGINLNVSGQGKTLSSNNQLMGFLKKLKDHPQVYCPAATFILHIQGGDFRVTYNERHNQAESMPAFYFENSQIDPDLALRVSDGLFKYLHAGSKPLVIAAGLPQAERDIVAHRQQVVAELEANVAMIGKFALEQSKRQSEYLEKLTASLEKKYQEREAALTARGDQQQIELDEKRKAFEAEKAAFDDRDRTHVRRELLEKLNTLTDAYISNVSVSSATANKRWIIHAVCLAIMAAAGALVGTYANKILNAASFDWRLEAPLLTGSVLFVSTAIYYLRWNNHWFAELAKAEFTNRKFKADITRASWIVELFFEYKDEKGIALPLELIQSLTQNLFAGVDWQSQGHHPLDTLSELWKGANRVKIGPEGVDVMRGKNAKGRGG